MVRELKVSVGKKSSAWDQVVPLSALVHSPPPAEAANPVANFRDRSSRENAGYTCESGDSVFTGGRIRMTLNCRSSNGQPDLRQAMVGSYGADRFQAAVTGETATPASDALPSYPVRIASTLIGRRIGDCPAGTTN